MTEKTIIDAGATFLGKVLASVSAILAGKLTLPAINLRFSAPLSGGRSWTGVKTYEVHPPTKTVKLDKDGYVNKDGSEESVKVDEADRYVVLVHFAKYADASERTAKEPRSTETILMDALHAAIRATAHNNGNRKGNVNGTSKLAQEAYTAAGFSLVKTKDEGESETRTWTANAGTIALVKEHAAKVGDIPPNVLLDVTGFPRMQGAAMGAATCVTEGCKVTLRATIAQIRDNSIDLAGARCLVHNTPIAWAEDMAALIETAKRAKTRAESKGGRPSTKKQGKGKTDAADANVA